MSLLSVMKDAPRGFLSMTLPDLEAKKPYSLLEKVLLKTEHHLLRNSGLSAREKYAVAFCRAYMEHCGSANAKTEADLHRVGALLLQLAILKDCSLQERVCGGVYRKDGLLDSQDDEFLYLFCATTRGWIEMSTELNQQKSWNLFDIVDGRVFYYLLRAIRSKGEVPSGILGHARVLYNEFVKGLNLGIEKPFATLNSLTDLCAPPKTERRLTALPFSHPVLESLLKDVEIGESEEAQDPAAELVFEDLRHWHAYRPVIQIKSREQIPLWVEKRRQKKMQLRMSEVLSYAASLTSSTGKNFSRETVVVGS